MKYLAPLLFFILLMILTAKASSEVVNIYAWSGEIPEKVIRRFEDETGIKVNISTYGNNEVMYAKMRAVKNPGYDIIMPSSYFVDRMARQQMLDKLDKSKLPELRQLNPDFSHPAYDPDLNYSVPFIWGITGIFYNDQDYPVNSIKKWSDLWEKRFYNKLLLLDDTREIFSMALLSLGYSANDKDPEHIKAAFLRLKKLMQNIKVFSSDSVVSIITDEDATAGMAWNGDTFKASRENPHVRFVLPEEGFIIWVDNFSIPKNAPHKDAAYKFINFILRPDIAKETALATHFSTANLGAFKLLPADIRDNPTAYPPSNIMHRGEFQTDVGDDTLALYETYWNALKMSG